MPFRDEIRRASETNSSKIVLALDVEGSRREEIAKKSKRVLQKVGEYICALKINRQLVLSLGLQEGVDSIVKLAHQLSVPTIMDAKLNDIAHTNEFMLRSYIEAGFDAVIASPVAGWEGGLDVVFKLAQSHRKSIILLVYMSNPGADAFYSLMVSNDGEKSRPVFELLTQTAVQWKADGVVVGATKPEIITRVRRLIGPEMIIFSPGVGVQGGNAKKAIAAGADYLIVGRAIWNASDPAVAAKSFRDLTA